MSSPSAERGQEVRQRLCAAAAELIPERGWTAVSTRVVAERAGVPPSAVHYHFPSLAALLNEAVIGLMREVVSGLDTVLDATRTPAEAVDVLLTSADQYSGSDSTSLLFIEAYLAASRDEQLREQISDVFTRFRHRFGQWLGERGVTAPEEAAAALLAAVDGLLLHRGLGAGQDFRSTTGILHRLVDQ